MITVVRHSPFPGRSRLDELQIVREGGTYDNRHRLMKTENWYLRRENILL